MRLSDWSSDVCSSDLAEFLQRVYVNGVRNLKVGRCRYGLMLSEHGIVYDDGVFAKIAEDHFLVGTTSGRSEEHTSELQSLMRILYAVFCLKKKKINPSTTLCQTYKKILQRSKSKYKTEHFP